MKFGKKCWPIKRFQEKYPDKLMGVNQNLTILSLSAQNATMQIMFQM